MSPICSHVPGSSIEDYVAIYVGPFPRKKTSRRGARTSRPNLVTFRTPTFIIFRESSFLIRRKYVQQENSEHLIQSYLHLPSDYGVLRYFSYLIISKDYAYSLNLFLFLCDVFLKREFIHYEYMYFCDFKGWCARWLPLWFFNAAHFHALMARLRSRVWFSCYFTDRGD